MPFQNLTNLELVKQIGEDDEKAFDELYSRCWQKLFLFSVGKLKSEDEAKDVVQDVFIKFWDKRRSISVRESVEAYLITIARHEILTRISKNLKDKQKAAYYSEYILPEFSELFDPIQLEELTSAIDKAVNNLPDRLREIHRLNKYENLSIKEIALMLDLSEQTVKNQLSTALKRLRSSLKEVMTAIIISQITRL